MQEGNFSRLLLYLSLRANSGIFKLKNRKDINYTHLDKNFTKYAAPRITNYIFRIYYYLVYLSISC